MYPIPEDETERLNRIETYGLMGLGKDPDLDVFAEAASLITDCPVSLIAMMERDEQVIQSCIGLELATVDRKYTICQYTIMSPEILIIEDTASDPRSSVNPLVQQGGIRFYAGIPLRDEEGYALGTLCVIDYKPRRLDVKQQESLFKLGIAITKLLLEKKRRVEAGYYAEIFHLTKNMICVIDRRFQIKDVNPAFEDSFGRTKDELKATPFFEVLDQDEVQVQQMLSRLLQNKNSETFSSHTQTEDGSIITVDWYLNYHAASHEIFGFGRNVTQELEEKLKLERSERRFRNFFEHAIGLMSVHDMQGNILAVNEKGRALLQYSAEEVKSLNLQQLVPPQHIPLLKQYLKRIAEDKEDSGMMVLRAKDGQEIHWLYQNMLDIDEDGKPYVISTALNMTERIQLERDLLYTKNILEQTNVVAKVGGWEVDFTQNTVYWSDSTKDIHGVERSYKPDFSSAVFFFEHESQVQLQRLFAEATEQGKSYDAELKLQKQDGSTTWVRVKGIPEFENGVCQRVFGIIQDIDRSKKLYLEVQRQEAMLQAFVNYVPAAAAMFDREMNFVSVSQQWMNEFHQDSEKVVGKNLYHVFDSVPEERRQIYREALAGKPYKNVDQLIAIGGMQEPQHFNWEVRPWHMSDGSIGGIIILVQNITDNVAAHEELRKAKEAADLASKAKSEFLANMSHEIRTPLNGVIGFSDLLLKTPLNEIQKQYLHYINESGNSLLNIINDILDFSKIESGKLELYIDKHNIYDLGHQVINVVLYQAQRKDIELLLNIEPGLPPIVHIDEVRIKQVLINLLANAVKFTEQGEIELKIEKLRSDEKILSLLFSVRDTGIGISPDKQQRIFEAFTQEDSSVSKKYGGTGLGLTISNSILHYMGGQLSLVSAPHSGSVFSFAIDLAYEEEDDNVTVDLPIKRVLIVDDNDNNRTILQHMLTYRNIDSKQAANGLEALQILMQGERFDVVLMDYHMPILSGLETIEKIKALFSQEGELTPLIVLHTSSEEEEVISSFRKEDRSFCLLKPIKSAELYATLQRATQHYVQSPAREMPEAGGEQLVYLQKLDVLIADDNPVNMALNLRMMHSLVPNASLTEVVNGAQAIDACVHKLFDLILMDVQMPEVDGIEATKKIRQLSGYADTPIIAVTAGNVLGEREKCLDAGMSDFLPKPIRQHDLYQVLKRFTQSLNPEQQQSIVVEEHLDRKLLHEQAGDDPDFLSFFLGLIMQEIRQSEDDLQQARAANDLAALRTALHKLRGTTATAGLFKLSALLSAAETDPSDFVHNETTWRNLKREIEVATHIFTELLNGH